jgi:hypothetical protein
MEAIPVLRDLDGPTLAEQLGRERRIVGTKDGLERSLVLPPLAGPILRAIDGHRSLREIHARLSSERRLDERAFLQAFATLYRPLHGVNWLLLRRAA